MAKDPCISFSNSKTGRGTYKKTSSWPMTSDLHMVKLSTFSVYILVAVQFRTILRIALGNNAPYSERCHLVTFCRHKRFVKNHCMSDWGKLESKQNTGHRKRKTWLANFHRKGQLKWGEEYCKANLKRWYLCTSVVVRNTLSKQNAWLLRLLREL